MTRETIFIAVLIAAVVLLAVPLSIRYEEEHVLHAVPAVSIGDPASRHHVLIATQGTDFKDELVSAIIADLRRHGVFISQIDISALPQVRAADWSAIILLHDWKFGRAPGVVRQFVDRLPDRHRLIVVTTSGGGHEKLPGVDAISTASVDRDVPSRLAEIRPRLEQLLRPDTR
jgi:hypothetical protein